VLRGKDFREEGKDQLAPSPEKTSDWVEGRASRSLKRKEGGGRRPRCYEEMDVEREREGRGRRRPFTRSSGAQRKKSARKEREKM